MELKTVVLKRKKDGIVGLFARSLAVMVGVTLTIVGALLVMTIIGILPGIGLCMFGILITVGGLKNTQQTKCPHCKKDVNVQKDAEDFRCPRCEKVSILNWITY